MSTSTVSATVQDPSGQIFANGTWQLFFKTTFGTPGMFTDGGVFFTQIYGGNLDATGSFSQPNVNRNDTILPAGSRWTLTVKANTNNNAFSVDLNVNSGAFNASSAINAAIANISVPATALAHAYKDSEVVSNDAGSLYYDVTNKILKIWDSVSGVWQQVAMSGGSPTFTGLTVTPGLSSLSALTASGNVTETAGQNQYSAFKIDNLLYVDGIKYTTIQAALNDLGANGGTVYVCPNATGRYTETLTANIVFTKSGTRLEFLCPALISTAGFVVTAASGVNNISIISPYIHGTNAATNAGVVFQGYTGAVAQFNIGDSSGFTDNFYMRGIAISLDTGALANATGLLLTNCRFWSVEYCWCTQGAVAGQVGIKTLGTGAFFCGIGRIESFEIGASASATNNFGIQIGAISNDIVITGGHANMGGSANGSVSIDVLGTASSGIICFGFDADVCQTALTIESTANTAFWGFLRCDSGTTNLVNFGANSFGNTVYTNGNFPFTDNGLAGTNSVINPARQTWRTDKWRSGVQATFAEWFIDLVDNSSRVVMVNGAGGRTDINGGTGAGEVDFNREQGTGGVHFYNGTTEVLTVDGNGTLHPFVAGAVAAGTTALPFLEFKGKRFYSKGGTAYSGADAAIVLSAGWGTTRTVSAATGFDQAFSFSVNATGTGQAASPTITITFKDGTWTTAPQVIVLRNDLVTPFNTPPHTIAVTATTLTITFNGTPTAANVYSYIVTCIGV